jgi:DNA-binding NarL/FixJ family response regulator
VRVVIAEDDVLLAEGLTLVLSRAGHEVVRRVGEGPAFVAAATELRPDVSIVDVRMPPGHGDEGIRAALAARRRIPGLPVLVLSQYVETSYAAELLADAGGGLGYLLKDRVGHVEEFVEAVVTVAGGGTVMDPEVVRQLLARRIDDPLERLSPRESEVLALMAEGQDNTAIRNRLRLADSSLQKHIGSIFSKLGLQASDSGHRRVLAVLAYLGRTQR